MNLLVTIRTALIAFVVSGLVLVPVVVTSSTPPPNPVLVLTGSEPYSAGGKQFLRLNYQIFNADSFPPEMWDPSPTLAPCGTNTKASRTWVDFYDQSGKRLFGFCALRATNFKHVWFPVDEGAIPPSWVYIEMTDRLTNTKYRSNLAETTL